MVTRVHIDGFNLYHGAIRANSLHWLDLAEFSKRLNRGMPVDRVIYCTAMVASTSTDSQKAQRQDIYHRALSLMCPSVEIVKGQFTSHKKFQPIANCGAPATCLVSVVIRNEKGSDVNLASRLLHDAHLGRFEGRFERAIVVSGDSDLVEPIRLVTQEIGKVVWVRNPRDVHSEELAAVSSDYGRIRHTVLKDSQFTDSVTNGAKTYTKPAKWLSPPIAKTKTEVAVFTCPQNGCANNIKTFNYV